MSEVRVCEECGHRAYASSAHAARIRVYENGHRRHLCDRCHEEHVEEIAREVTGR